MLINLWNFRSILIFFLLLCSKSFTDSFQYNSYNNHGVIGLINIPTARFYDEGSFGFTFYKGDPDQKLTISSSPYDWLEASLFYTNIDNNPSGCNFNTCYKDKGFNFKIRIREEDKFPAIAIGFNDIGGTGLYNSEFIVASYGIDSLDMHFGLGWGSLNGGNTFKNPLSYIHDSFSSRPPFQDAQGGQFQIESYFSGKMSPFYGLSYAVNKKLLFKIEKDYALPVGYERFSSSISNNIQKNDISYGFDYSLNKNFSIGIAKDKNDYISLRFSYKKNPMNLVKKYDYKKPNKYKKIKNKNDYNFFIDSLESNGIGVNKIIEGAEKVGIEVTQFTHTNLDVLEQIIRTAKSESQIDKDIQVDYRIADLQAYSSIDEELLANPKLIFQRKKTTNFNTSTKLNIRPFVAAREDFLKIALILDNNSEYVLKDNLFFSSNLKYSIYDNFDDLYIPPRDVYPAQVRSDVKDYMNNLGDRIVIGRAQFDYYLTPKMNNHIMISGGIFEEMFSGYGFEYLYFDVDKSFAYGFEAFHVKKRDYEMQFGTLDYDNITASVNLYYRNHYLIPFDAKVSVGEYLAGDFGTTFELSRTYKNGMRFGIFATFTNVSSEQFGEGSFDKGLYFTVPIFNDNLSYAWRPLTKDPGARIIRKNSLHDLLVKFRSYD